MSTMLVPRDSLRGDLGPEKVDNGHLLDVPKASRSVRIETQIHRRRTVKALSLLMLEWEQVKPESPGLHLDQEEL